CPKNSKLECAFEELEKTQPLAYRLWRLFKSVGKEALYWEIRQSPQRIMRILKAIGLTIKEENSMEPHEAEALLTAFAGVPRSKSVRPTLLEIAGYPHYENVCSNILQFFLDPAGPHGLGSLCLDALFRALGKATALPQCSVVVEREVMTNQGNRLDLVVESDTHLVGIENKIWHVPNNPFSDYAAYLKGRSDRTQPPKIVLKVLLSLWPPSSAPGDGFVLISHQDMFEKVREGLGFRVHEADAGYLTLLIDLMTTMENLTRGAQMNAQWIEFIRKHKEEVTDLLKEVDKFKAEMRTKVKNLGSLIDVCRGDKVRQSFYREANVLNDVLVHDITVAEELPVALDTVISPSGWEISIFVRPGGNFGKLRDHLGALGIEFEEHDRLIYPTRFGYNEALETIRPHVQGLVDKLSR
ncbi:MAG: PD-(D/E)XK nuclease family protein, partial [Pseudomonadota bacterium]